MGIIHYENWDGVTTPTIPSNWNVSLGMVTTIAGATPITSPNMLLAPGGGSGYNVATWGTQDGNSGNIVVQGTGQFASPGSVVNSSFAVLARGNSNPISYISSIFYEFTFSPANNAFEINYWSSALSSPLFSISLSSTPVSSGIWYQITATLSNTSLSATVQRLSDGYWLNMVTGSWDSSYNPPYSIASVTDSSISGQGYTGWSAIIPPLLNTFADDWTLSTAGGTSQVFDSDSSYSSESSGSIFLLNSDSPFSLESQLLSPLVFSTESIFPLELAFTSLLSIYQESATGLENQFIYFNLGDIFSSDSSTATDQYLLSTLYIDLDQPISIDQYLISQNIYLTDYGYTSDYLELYTVSFGITTLSLDSATGSESQSTHNVMMTYDHDSASASENQLILVPFFMDVDAGSANESQYIELLASDLSYEREIQVLSSVIIISTDQAFESDTQLKTNSGGSSATVYDSNPTVGIEAWLRLIEPTDSAHELDSQYINLTIISSSNIDSIFGSESLLPIRFSSESPTAIESYLFINNIIIVESSSGEIGQESQWLYNLIPVADRSIATDVYILFTTFVDISPANIDSSFGSESQLPIRSSSSSAFELDTQSLFILSFDNPKSQETILRFIFDTNPTLATDLAFLSNAIITIGSAVTESVLAHEAALPIRSSGESSTGLKIALPIILDVNPGFAVEADYLVNSLIDTSSGVTDSAFGFAANLVIMMGADAGYDIDTGGDSQTVIPVPQPSTSTLIDVLLSIQSYIQSTGLFGPGNVEFVVDPDSVILFPNQGGPICLIEPSDMNTAGDDIGGGRFSKTWDWKIKIHCILENIYDVAFRDFNLSTSFNTQSGPYRLVDQVQQLMEQAYLTNQYGQATVYEFPFYESTEQPRKYKGANNYIGFPIVFRVLFKQNLPANLP